MSEQFWKQLSLAQMSHEQWESICDGCGKCCLQQLEDEDSGQLVFTDLACNLLDCESARCTDYANRTVRVPECLALNKDNVNEAAAMAPSTCAYRLLVQGDELPDWHPLITGDPDSALSSGKSVAGRVTHLASIEPEDLEDHVVFWPES